MVWVDYLVLFIIAISALIGLWRGFVKEAFSLASWILAFWVSLFFSHPFASLLESLIEEPSLRMGVAYIVLFILTLLVGAIVSRMVGGLVKLSGLTGLDRTLGVGFGLLRGVVVMIVLVLLAGLTPIPAETWWEDSFFLSFFEELAIWSKDILADDIAALFSYR